MISRTHRARILGLIFVSLLVMGLDQFSKYWLLNVFGMAQRPPLLLTEFFSLVMVWNHGVSFGMMSHVDRAWAPLLLIAVSVVISLILLRLGLRTRSALERVAYGMVIGGAMGNVVDRIRVGAVADFFYFHWHEAGWPAFNVADSAICIGVCILLLTMLRNPKVGA